MSPRRYISVLLLAVVSLLLICVPWSDAAPSRTVIRAGRITGDMSVYPVAWTAAQGLYDRAGLEVRFIDFGSGTDAVRALISGDIDIFLTTMISTLVLAKARGGPDIWSVFQLSDNTIFLFVVKANAPIRSVTDLKGKKVAITRFGSGSDFIARAILAKHGLKAEEDVTLVQAGSIPAGIAAVEKGDMDAAVAWHPLAGMGVEKGALRVLATGRDETPGLEPTTPAMNGAFLKANLPAARAFVRTTLAGLTQLRAQIPQAAQQAAQAYGLPESVARMTLEFYTKVWTTTGRFDEKGIIDTQLWLIRVGQIERIVPMTQLVRTDLLP